MKNDEKRILELFIKEDLVVGGVLRNKILEHLIIEKNDENFLNRLEKRSFIKEVRFIDVMNIGGKNEEILVKALKANIKKELVYKELYESIVNGLKEVKNSEVLSKVWNSNEAEEN
ncbi:hypothetical protein IOK49_04645 [Fervidicoccus fontis]|uniref:Uncharacterized protein n=1 Tax=Fervidicoccus fontis TaxID=683846 RepID=A0A843AKA2_9CREN|nr:hypothetical protein [Fervidicoccus fontis]MBE9391361.1 hypothetical protein [Fervidicoccus fontis]